ncbi:hypothetical protein D3C74_288970 [compost metagenome]
MPQKNRRSLTQLMLHIFWHRLQRGCKYFAGDEHGTLYAAERAAQLLLRIGRKAMIGRANPFGMRRHFAVSGDILQPFERNRSVMQLNLLRQALVQDFVHAFFSGNAGGVKINLSRKKSFPNHGSRHFRPGRFFRSHIVIQR